MGVAHRPVLNSSGGLICCLISAGIRTAGVQSSGTKPMYTFNHQLVFVEVHSKIDYRIHQDFTVSQAIFIVPIVFK